MPTPPWPPRPAWFPAPRSRPFLTTGLLLSCSVSGNLWAETLQPGWFDDWYVSAGAGWVYADTIDLDSSGARMEFDRGVSQFTAAVGRRWRQDWRVELAYSSQEVSPEILYSSSAGVEVDPDSRDAIKATSLLINVIRDLHVGQAWRPYLGAGIGAARVDLHFSELEIDGPFLQRPRRDIVNDDDTALAMQVIAGFTVPVTRRLELAADVRYWHAPNVNLEEVSGADLKTNHSVRSAWLHLRYHGSAAGVFPDSTPREPPRSGWYVTGGLGGAFPQDEDIEDQLTVIDAYDLDATTSLAVGYHVGRRWRFELEAGYWDNAVEVLEFSPEIGEDAASGSVESYTLMANAIYQFAPGSAVRPFFGLGGGIMRAEYDIRTAGFCRNFVCAPDERRLRLVDDKGTASVAQALIGVDVAISERLSFTAAYRYLITGTIDMQQVDGTPFSTDRNITGIVAGLRFGLGGGR